MSWTLLLLVLASTAWAICPNGTLYEAYFNKCYKMNTQPLDFLAAEQSCDKLGGTLVAIQSMFETVYVSGIASASTPAPSFWIGANYLMNPQWTWTTREPVVFTNWAPNQPSDPSAYECATVREQDNMWIKEQCNSRRPSVCQIDLNTSSSPSPPLSPSPSPFPSPTLSACPANPVCSPGYTFYIGTCKCYKVFDPPELPFTDAQAVCAQENGVLPKIPDKSTNDFLYYTLVNDRYDSVWIGLNCPNDRDSCQWQDGTPLDDSSLYINYLLVTGIAGYTAQYAKQWETSGPGDRNNIVCQKDTSSDSHPNFYFLSHQGTFPVWAYGSSGTDAYICQKDPTTATAMLEGMESHKISEKDSVILKTMGDQPNH